MDADADIGLLEALESEIGSRLQPTAAGDKPVLAAIEDSFSNSIQISGPLACLAENIATELDLLMKMYVEPLKVKSAARRTGRAAIAAAMRTQFERAGVWALMRKRIAASIYTQPGDPMKLDCGYRPVAVPGGEPNGVIKIFHAVSLEADVEAAKVLAWSAPRLQQGVERVEGTKLELAAVVEPLRAISGEYDLENEEGQGYRFGVETMESQQIRVLTINDLARAAETARIELRL
jgi:hypothetical protein